MHAKLATAMPEPPVTAVSVRYAVTPVHEAWVLPEGPVPESTTHDRAVQRIKELVDEWARREQRHVMVARNLAIRWMSEAPSVGVDPDVCVIDPAPPEEDLSSIRAWDEGHVVPRLCFEVVSASHPYKDYVSIQDRYASMGTRELVVFDPLLAGPAAFGGPVLLQLWRRDGGLLERVHFGDGAAFSNELGAWIVPSQKGLDFADDRAGRQKWPTGEERERENANRERESANRERENAARSKAEAEHAQRRAEEERAAREDVERRLAALEGKVGRH